MRKSLMPLVFGLAVVTASAATALPGRDGDNNPWPTGSEHVRHAAPMFGGGIFAGPRVRARHAGMMAHWDRCVRRDETSCVHN